MVIALVSEAQLSRLPSSRKEHWWRWWEPVGLVPRLSDVRKKHQQFNQTPEIWLESRDLASSNLVLAPTPCGRGLTWWGTSQGINSTSRRSFKSWPTSKSIATWPLAFKTQYTHEPNHRGVSTKHHPFLNHQFLPRSLILIMSLLWAASPYIHNHLWSANEVNVICPEIRSILILSVPHAWTNHDKS